VDQGGNVFEADGDQADSNLNGIHDDAEIAVGRALDAGGNGIPNRCEAPFADCECPAHLDGDGVINVTDFHLLLTFWGPCPLR
jgi:hypothetical protein